MRKFVVPKTSTVKVDAELARMERAAVMAAKAGVANSLGLSWSPPLKKRVWRPSRRIGFPLFSCEILGFVTDELPRKHLPRMFSLVKNEG